MGIVFAQNRYVIAKANPFKAYLAFFPLSTFFSLPQSIVHQLPCTGLFHVTLYTSTTASHRWYDYSSTQIGFAFSLVPDCLLRVSQLLTVVKLIARWLQKVKPATHCTEKTPNSLNAIAFCGNPIIPGTHFGSSVLSLPPCAHLFSDGQTGLAEHASQAPQKSNTWFFFSHIARDYGSTVDCYWCNVMKYLLEHACFNSWIGFWAVSNASYLYCCCQ